ncbi:hypothetical protein POM88_043209 [Heracleum sosnowskyi]|uniref:F-box domain-containing protein n=1 Tax=Heracleum sosnowskyi TaxID=360622 RepID=A0AAD8H315_9APIA|nr:hypothetical protein POM88_043209 [Heracleum sosnowskyi]
MAADYSSLPLDIIEQILIKTQCIKSIVTCTLVCKSWQAFITKPGSMNMHRLSPNNNGKTYYLCSLSDSPGYSMQCYDGTSLEKYYNLIFPHGGYKIVGCCNGLICYTEFRNNIYLWNPSIRKLKVVPKSLLDYDEPVAYGFWFDMSTEDYKVAKVSCMEKSKVEVYSLKSNSWDVITTSGPSGPDLEVHFDSVVHVTGTLYWLICRKGDWKIISLDTKNGMFEESLIRACSKERSKIVLLAPGDNSHFFFLVRFDWQFPRVCLNVWVYDKSSNKPYLTEFKVPLEDKYPVGVKNNSHEVLFQRYYHRYEEPVLVSNHRDFKFRKFIPSTFIITRARPFVKTLVLLNDGDSSSTTNTQFHILEYFEEPEDDARGTKGSYYSEALNNRGPSSIEYYDSERLHKYSDLKFPQEGYIKIFGSCNGLICYARFQIQGSLEEPEADARGTKGSDYSEAFNNRVKEYIDRISEVLKEKEINMTSDVENHYYSDEKILPSLA